MQTSKTTDSISVSPEQASRQLDLKDAVNLINASLKVIERSAWQLRHFAKSTYGHYQWLEGETRSLWQFTRLLPQRMARLSRCGWMLTRILGAYRLWPVRSAFIKSKHQAKALERLHRKAAQMFVETSLIQGGAFLKIGQLMSTRSDLLPPVWIEELSRLQDQAQPVAADVIKRAMEDALERPLSDIFAHFEEEPLACASIGQVHRATLHDGREVVVKVQRPHIAELVDTDMLLLGLFIGNVDAFLPGMDIATIFDEIKRALQEELDYEREAEAMRRVGCQLNKIDGVSSPAVIDEWCRPNLLVTEFVQGKKLTRVLDEYKKQGNQTELTQVMTRLLDAWLFQVLQLGFFQADPHPGNLLVTEDNQLQLLDFGACQALTDHHRRYYLRVLQAAIVGDEKAIAESLHELGFRTQSGQPDTLIAFTHALISQLCERRR